MLDSELYDAGGFPIPGPAVLPPDELDTPCTVIRPPEYSDKDAQIRQDAVRADHIPYIAGGLEDSGNPPPEMIRNVFQTLCRESTPVMIGNKFKDKQPSLLPPLPTDYPEDPLVSQYWNEAGEFTGQDLDETGEVMQIERFLQEYLIDCNPGRAAIATGLSKSVNMTDARTIGLKYTRALKRVIRARLSTVAGRCGITAEKVLKELANLAFSNMGSYITEDNSIVNLKALPPDKMAAVSEITVDGRYEGFGEERTQIGEKVKLKLYNKLDALKTLGMLKSIALLGSDQPQTASNQPPVFILFGETTQAQILSHKDVKQIDNTDITGSVVQQSTTPTLSPAEVDL